MELLAVDDLTLSRILLYFADPWSVACSCKRIRSVVSEPSFQRDWFLRWHPKLAHGRPMPYAALTWQRARGWTAGDVASWILTCLQGLEAAPQDTEHLQDPSFGPYPLCQPNPKRIVSAEALLRKGSDLPALMKLCPQAPLLLLPYAVKAGNQDLVISLAHQLNKSSWFWTLAGCRLPLLRDGSFSVWRLAALTALDTGRRDMLLLVFSLGGAYLRHSSSLLLSHAVTHSTSSCCQATFAFTGSCSLSPWLQHLVMASGRKDPLAGEVVALLLSCLPPKLLAPKTMAQVYTAAVKAGNPAVLQQLLTWVIHQHQEQQQQLRQQLTALLAAAAGAGNCLILRDLLACGVRHKQCSSSTKISSSSSGGSSSGGDGGGGESSSSSSSSSGGINPTMSNSSSPTTSSSISHYLPSLPWSILPAAAWADAILAALPEPRAFVDTFLIRWRHTYDVQQKTSVQLHAADLLMYAARKLGGFSKAVMAKLLKTYPHEKLCGKAREAAYPRWAWLCLNGVITLPFVKHGQFRALPISPSLLLRLLQNERRCKEAAKLLSISSGWEGSRAVENAVIECWEDQLEQAFVKGDFAAARWLATWQQYQVVAAWYAHTLSISPQDLVQVQFDVEDRAWKVFTATTTSTSSSSGGVSGTERANEGRFVSLDGLAEELKVAPELYARLKRPVEDEQRKYLQQLLGVVGEMQEMVQQWEGWVGEVLQQEQWQWGDMVAVATADVIKEVLDAAGYGSSMSSSGSAGSSSSKDGRVGSKGAAINSGRSGSSSSSSGSAGSSSSKDGRVGSKGAAINSGRSGSSNSSSVTALPLAAAESPVWRWLANLRATLQSVSQCSSAIIASADWVAGACRMLPSSKLEPPRDWVSCELTWLPFQCATVASREGQQQQGQQQDMRKGHQEMPAGIKGGEMSAAATKVWKVEGSQQQEGGLALVADPGESSDDTSPQKDQEKAVGQVSSSSSSDKQLQGPSQFLPTWQLIHATVNAFIASRGQLFGCKGQLVERRLQGCLGHWVDWVDELKDLASAVNAQNLAAGAAAAAGEVPGEAATAARANAPKSCAAAAASIHGTKVHSDVRNAMALIKQMEQFLLSSVKVEMLRSLRGMGRSMTDLKVQLEHRLDKLAEEGKQHRDQEQECMPTHGKQHLLKNSQQQNERGEQQQQEREEQLHAAEAAAGQHEQGKLCDDQDGRGPLPLKQLLLLQNFISWPIDVTDGEAKDMVGAALLNQQFKFAEVAAAGNAAGDPNWWVAAQGMRSSPGESLKPAMCFARGRLVRMCVDLVREKQLGKEPIWDWEEGKEPGEDFGLLQFFGVVPPFRWLSRRQQREFEEQYRAEQHQMRQLELQLRYMPHLDQGVWQPRQIGGEQQGEAEFSDVGDELEIEDDVVQGVLELLDVPGMPKDWLLQWLRECLKAGATATDAAVVVQLLTAVGTAKKLPGGARFEYNGGLGEKLMRCKGAVDLFGAMTGWSARVCPYTC